MQDKGVLHEGEAATENLESTSGDTATIASLKSQMHGKTHVEG